MVAEEAAAAGSGSYLAQSGIRSRMRTAEDDLPVTHADVQAIMESLLDIRAGVDYLMARTRRRG